MNPRGVFFAIADDFHLETGRDSGINQMTDTIKRCDGIDLRPTEMNIPSLEFYSLRKGDSIRIKLPNNEWGELDIVRMTPNGYCIAMTCSADNDNLQRVEWWQVFTIANRKNPSHLEKRVEELEMMLECTRDALWKLLQAQGK